MKTVWYYMKACFQKTVSYDTGEKSFCCRYRTYFETILNVIEAYATCNGNN